MSPTAVAYLPLVAVCIFTSVSAVAADYGSCTYKDEKMEFIDGVAYTKPNMFDDKKHDTVVALSVNKLDKAAISTSKDLDHTMIFETSGGKVAITIPVDKVTSIYAFFPKGTNLNLSGTSFGDLKLASNDAKHVVGTFDLKATSKDEASCNLKFDVPMAR
jgi:hypothetical protein